MEAGDDVTASAAADVMNAINAEKLFAIVRGISADRIVPVARALHSGGVRLLEVAIDHSSSDGVAEVVRSLADLAANVGDELYFGAGTVLSPAQVRAVAAAGARFVVSPNVDPAVIAATRQAEMVSLPGAMTPTEVVTAREAGADAVKLFPAGVLGPAYVSALMEPLKGVPLIAVGGISDSNAASYLAAGATAVGVGGSLVNRRDAATGDWSALENRARALIAALRPAR